jgi:hypothetical protein
VQVFCIQLDIFAHFYAEKHVAPELRSNETSTISMPKHASMNKQGGLGVLPQYMILI